MCYGCCCCGFSDQDGKFKALEIALIALHCLSIILLILCLAFISWDELNSTCLALFIVMLVLIVGKLIIASFIRHWGSSGLNKTTKKETVFCLCIFGVVLVVINFVICIIAETVTTSAFIKANFPCTDDLKKSLQNFEYNDECTKDEDFKIDVISIGQYFLAYVTFSYLEMALIGKGVIFIAIRILLQNATRIRVGGPTVRPSQVVYPQNAVVIMQQPGQVVYPVQYQQPIQQAYLYNQPANSGYQQQIPNQQQYQYNSQPALVPQQSYSIVPNSNEELKKNNNSWKKMIKKNNY